MPDIIEITDLNDDRIGLFTRLTEAQLRNRLEPEKGIFIAESAKVVRLALEMGCKPVAYLMERRQLTNQGREFIENAGSVPIFTADDEVLEGLTGYRLYRGVLAAMRRPKLPSVDEVLKDAHRVAVLEGIVDSTNIGAIFRSAAALNVDAVLVTANCGDPLYRRAVRVSMGTVFQVPWTRIGETNEDWPERGLEKLRSLGFKSAAMALSDDSVSIDDERLNKEEKLCIVFGTEGDGLAKETIARCDYTVRIPMAHGVDSLNVASAAAVAFWQLRMR
ncbi:MAG: RNA methyltransferase [Clostridiales bacterium]|nr:RNA methyltransferase [Clostridiales bacterium]MDY5702810.1 RNA methyltransferase [Eubacteriales bacterium]